MQAVILAGGFGTRLSEETSLKPKPMVEIGGRPLLWHIMKIYSHYGVNDFIICLGYKGEIIKNYFANYFLYQSNVRFDLSQNKMEILQNQSEPWSVTLVDTGQDTMTGGRIKRVSDYITNDHFCLTYGDGVSNVNISDLIQFHKQSGKLATVTAVQPPGRFGSLIMNENQVEKFEEKPVGDGGSINGGFFVLSKKVMDYIDGDETIWERAPLQNLAKNGELQAYSHNNFWQAMDTLREKQTLEALWKTGEAPWKVWS